MPSESRTPSEPTLEELSAYLDHELDASAQARVAEHVAGCADCQTRLDGLRQTAYAIRGLPMETPPRTFSIPAQPHRQRNWAPAGWIGSLAAATLLVAFGVTHLHFSSAGTESTAGGGAAAPYSAPNKAAEPLSRADQAAGAYLPANTASVADPRDPSRSLAIGTDARAYPTTGVIRLRVSTSRLSVNEASAVRIFLVRGRGQGGYAVRLTPPTSASTFPLKYDAAYPIPQMPLPAPVPGDYTLQVEIQLSDGSALIAWLPLTITS